MLHVITSQRPITNNLYIISLRHSQEILNTNTVSEITVLLKQTHSAMGNLEEDHIGQTETMSQLSLLWSGLFDDTSMQ